MMGTKIRSFTPLPHDVSLAWIIHEPFCRVCSAQRKEYECPEKSAYVVHCGSEASEIHLPLFIDETHPHE
jgi:hypothetical protein